MVLRIAARKNSLNICPCIEFACNDVPVLIKVYLVFEDIGIWFMPDAEENPLRIMNECFACHYIPHFSAGNFFLAVFIYSKYFIHNCISHKFDLGVFMSPIKHDL